LVAALLRVAGVTADLVESNGRFMSHITCRLTAKNRDQLLNPVLGNRVWATFTFFTLKTLSTASCVVVGPRVCGGVAYGIRPMVAALPSWFRFAQCLRRYRDTRLAFPHLVNAGKYATTFFVVIFSTLHSIYKGSYDHIAVSPVFLISLVVHDTIRDTMLMCAQKLT